MIQRRLKRLPPTATTILVTLSSLIVASCSMDPAPLNIKPAAVQSFDTGLTISKVRTAREGQQTYIIGSSYEGTLIALDYQGKERWRNTLTGYMHHDIWTADLDNDGIDEILAASADGSITCVDHQGKQLWQFKANDVPMMSVTTIRNGKGETYVAAGGNDLNFYWLSATGKLVKKVHSSTYETMLRPNKIWLDDGTLTYNVHAVNHVRPLPQPDGSDVLVLNGVLSNDDRSSAIFQFAPLASKPFKSNKLGYGYGPVGDFRIRDHRGDGNYEVLLGTSGMTMTTELARFNPKTGHKERLDFPKMAKKIGFGYRTVQSEVVPVGNSWNYLMKAGSDLMLVPPTLDLKRAERLSGTYSYNDMWRDPVTGNILLASSQSGGSDIHVINTAAPDWKQAYQQLEPNGKIKAILSNTATLQQGVDHFKQPTWERDPIPVYLMSPPKEPKALISELTANYKSPLFMGYAWSKQVEKYDRSIIGNKALETTLDGRKKYTLTQQEVIDQISGQYNKNGLTSWGGHGVDPFYYQSDTLKQIMKNGKGRQSVFIWPELTILNKKEFPVVVEKLFTPLAKSAREYNSKLFLRNKHNFWLANIYSPEWSRFLSGEFSDVAIASMEETQDMTMELSLAARLGLWNAGVFDSWGTRCARDNPSIMRSRQFSHQNLPNHFLRNAVFHAAYGAEYINNFAIKSKYSNYMSVLWEMIAKGVLYVPKKNEIVSYNPVHLSMLAPDERFLREGHSTTASIRYEKDFHPQNPYVFSRLDGAWSGAANTQWDFSRYAAGVKERRQNFLAPYPNGMVLITPPQQGVFADKQAKRGAMIENLHPLYQGIMKEYYSDGRYYYSADGKSKYNADQYYKQVAQDIEQGAQQIPMSLVSGEVAWVAAQSAPNHIRLTIIDGGYLNPSEQIAQFSFNSVQPIKITDVLTGETLDFDKQASVKVPLGGFRFLDIELAHSL